MCECVRMCEQRSDVGRSVPKSSVRSHDSFAARRALMCVYTPKLADPIKTRASLRLAWDPGTCDTGDTCSGHEDTERVTFCQRSRTRVRRRMRVREIDFSTRCASLAQANK